MPLAYRVLISAFLGVVATYCVPVSCFVFFSRASHFFLISWRYITYPFLFFGLIIALVQLRREKRLGIISITNTILLVGLSFVMSFLGTLLGILLPIKRITVQFERMPQEIVHDGMAFLGQLFPANAFSVFGQPALLPLLVLAVLLGLNMHFDKESTEPTYNLCDSLSRIFYQILSWTMRFAWVPIFFFCICTVGQWRQLNFSHYTHFLWTLCISAVICSMIVTTILSYSLTTYVSPLQYWKDCLLYWPMALFCKNIYLNACAASYTTHQYNNIKRDLGAFSASYFALFARAGSAFVCSMAMGIILRSYSSLSPELHQVFTIFWSSWLASFMVSHVAESSFIAIFPIACALFGKPLVSGAHILEPVMFPMALLASFLDSMFLLFALNFISRFKLIEKNKRFKARSV